MSEEEIAADYNLKMTELQWAGRMLQKYQAILRQKEQEIQRLTKALTEAEAKAKGRT